jgi:hypothetical protein
MVDRLSPIDRCLKRPQPARQTAENRKTPPLARRVELLGTIALLWKTPPLARRAELLRTSALLCFLEDLAYHARWVDAC